MKKIVALLLLTLSSAAYADVPARLHWIGAVPSAAKPVSFGIPFLKGEMKASDAFTLTTDKGQEIPADFWPTAYWPDGSVKWGGFAAVVPGGTEAVAFSKVKKGRKSKAIAAAGQVASASSAGSLSPSALTVDESDARITVSTGPLQAYIPKAGQAFIDSLVLDGTTVAAAGRLVCTRQNRPYAEGVKEISFIDYTSQFEKVTVERAGTVRAVVKIEGTYMIDLSKTKLEVVPTSDGKVKSECPVAWLPFTLRLYFYAGSEQVRIVHTFTYDGNENADFIASLGLRFEVPMREQAYNRHVAFATQDGGVWTESVQPLNGRRVLMKDRDFSFEHRQVAGERIPEPDFFDEKNRELLHHWARWNTYRLAQLSDQGYTIQKRAHNNNMWIGTHTGRRADGYAFVGDVSGGLGVSVKDFWQSFPASLQVDSATHDMAYLTAYLWAPEAGAMDLRHYDNVAHDLNASYEDVQEGMSTPHGIARTSVLTLMPERAFPGKAAVAERARQATADAPLVCTPEYLHSRRAFGIWSLPDSSNERRAAVERQLADYLTFYERAVDERHWYGFWNYGDFMHGYDPVRHEWKYDVGGFAWDNTELGSISWLWYSFLRTADPAVWRMAEAMTRHTSEVDVYHIGPFAGLGSRHNVSHWGCGAKEARISQSAFLRFYYYLTCDDRTGDLMHDQTDADTLLYTLDPMRLAEPRSKFPCTAPARLRFGPDWLAYAGNWMTEYERTGNTKYLDKICTGLQSVSKMADGLFTGNKALGYYPDTGRITYEGDTLVKHTNHLATIMGGFEVMNEMLAVVPEATRRLFLPVWLDYARRYKQEALNISHNRFPVRRLQAYAAWQTRSPRLAAEAWDDLWNRIEHAEAPKFSISHIDGPSVAAPIDEWHGLSTNDAALWSLDAIYMNEVLIHNK